MIINIASFGGRTHMLDTARELEKFGHTVRFYSFVRDKRAIEYGLKRECNFSIFWFALPYLIILKLFGNVLWNRVLYLKFCDIFISYYMKPCDVFIGQSPMHYYALKRAKKKWNAITILERGTSHVIEFQNHLMGIPSFKPFSRYVLDMDLRGYNEADYISVGAEHVKQSFIKHGFAENKIFVNNYGFNVDEFNATEFDGEYDIIMVGNWSYRKGCDLIIEACMKKHYKCLHVGSFSDLKVPNMKYFSDIGPVDQKNLVNYYKKAMVFVLPSREEGLALVQMQAAACGLPIVCSQYSGGADIKKYCSDSRYIIELEKLDCESLCQSIDHALELSRKQIGLRHYLNNIHEVSFSGYGSRYNSFLNKISNTCI